MSSRHPSRGLIRFLVLLVFLAIGSLAVWVAERQTKIPLPQSDQPLLLYSTQLDQDLGDALVQSIKQAKHSIFLMVYTLTDPKVIAALNERADAGVDVRVIVDGKATTAIKRKLSPGATLMSRFGKKLMHLKILVIDRKLIWLGSANMTGASLHMHSNLMAAGVHPEMAEYILSEGNSLHVDGLSSHQGPRSFLFGNQEVELWLLPNASDASGRLEQLIKGAKKTLRIAMFTWTRRDLAQAVVSAKKRGVDVEVILDQNAGRGTGAKIVEMLRAQQIPVRLSQGGPLLHHKLMVVDGTTLVNGSANWTKSAFTENDDCFIVCSPLTEEQQRSLETLWNVLKSESQPVR